MAVTVQIPPLWRTAIGGAREVELPAGTVVSVLHALVEHYPPLGTYLLDERGEVRATLNLFINMEHIRYRGGLSAPVNDGDEIYIVPIITGGNR